MVNKVRFDFDRAKAIIDDRSEEKERKNGPFNECMDRSAEIVSGVMGKKVEGPETYVNLVALKLARLSYALEDYNFENYNEDHIFDAVCYLAALHNYIIEKQQK